MAGTEPLDGDHLISQAPSVERLHGLPPDNIARLGVHSVDVCDVSIDVVSLEQMLDCAARRIRQKLPAYIVTPNVDHICCWHKSAEFRRAYARAFLVVPDGVPLLWGARLLGARLGPKLSGSDLIYHVSKFAEQNRFSIYMLGAAEGVAERAAQILKSLYPNLKITGAYSPAKGFHESDRENDVIAARLKVAAPDICFLAFPGPVQEIWMYRNYRRCNVPLMIGMGAAFDFVAGTKRRAPKQIQRIGLEWFWRLCLEPRRLWKRYLVDDARFFALLAHQLTVQIKNPQLRTAAAYPLRAANARQKASTPDDPS